MGIFVLTIGLRLEERNLDAGQDALVVLIM